jgi:hypothetical protein
MNVIFMNCHPERCEATAEPVEVEAPSGRLSSLPKSRARGAWTPRLPATAKNLSIFSPRRVAGHTRPLSRKVGPGAIVPSFAWDVLRGVFLCVLRVYRLFSRLRDADLAHFLRRVGFLCFALFAVKSSFAFRTTTRNKTGSSLSTPRKSWITRTQVRKRIPNEF